MHIKERSYVIGNRMRLVVAEANAIKIEIPGLELLVRRDYSVIKKTVRST